MGGGESVGQSGDVGRQGHRQPPPSSPARHDLGRVRHERLERYVEDLFYGEALGEGLGFDFDFDVFFSAKPDLPGSPPRVPTCTV